MRTYGFIAAAPLGSILAAGQVHAQTLDQLLERVRQGAAADNQEFQTRLREFQQQQAQQDRLLQEARQQKAAEEQRSETLETQFEENELLVADVRQQLEMRLGSLRELFGVLQQISGNARSQFQNSLTNVEFPDRAQFLSDLAAKMGSSTQLASI